MTSPLFPVGEIVTCGLQKGTDTKQPKVNDYTRFTFYKSRNLIMTKYFDSNGTYKAYTKEGKNLFSESGEHIGYFTNGFLYDTKGQAVGHVRDKKILDKKGQTLYYTT